MKSVMLLQTHLNETDLAFCLGISLESKHNKKEFELC